MEQAESRSASSVRSMVRGGAKCCKDKLNIIECGTTVVETGTTCKTGREKLKCTGFA